MFLPTITPREWELIRLIANGLTNNEAAVQLQVSVRTIETHRKNIYRKVGCSSVSTLLLWLNKNVGNQFNS
ncbi:MAG: DNA-binding response regulator [Bacteroidetes bacterium]|nr:MAG: DNA-binding response regulator [Bacteroidota bacterium]